MVFRFQHPIMCTAKTIKKTTPTPLIYKVNDPCIEVTYSMFNCIKSPPQLSCVSPKLFDQRLFVMQCNVLSDLVMTCCKI